jgi:isocitrate dehydrogenase
VVRFADMPEAMMRPIKLTPKPKPKKDLVGVDVFVDWDNDPRDPDILGKLLEDNVNLVDLRLTMITNRGLKVYPADEVVTFCTDHWRCRFLNDHQIITHSSIIALLQRFNAAGLDFIKTEHLYQFDGVAGYSLGAGE